MTGVLLRYFGQFALEFVARLKDAAEVGVNLR
jgi:hypothetical protein